MTREQVKPGRGFREIIKRFPTEDSLFTIFVLPEYQRKGVGRAIIEALESDEYFLRANRIEIPASITGVPFYTKMGYGFKNGISEPDADHVIRMEKNRH